MIKWFRNVLSGRIETWDTASDRERIAELLSAKYKSDPKNSEARAALFADVTPSTDESPGGGSQPVACAAAASAIDIAATPNAYFVWDTIYDNIYEENELDDFPDGMGLTGKGTDTLTTTEAGIWALTLINFGVQTDATWEGQLSFGNFGTAPQLPLSVVTSGSRAVPPLAQVIALPSGVGFSVGISTVTPATSPSRSAEVGSLVIVRLA